MSTQTKRLSESDDLKQSVIKMCDGNPGAINVMMGLHVEFGETAIFTIRKMDALGIYGSDIWLAYKDVCGSSFDELDRRVAKDGSALVREIREAGGMQ